jgi:hypothetical protein
MIEKILEALSRIPLMKGILPSRAQREKKFLEEMDDDPDYRYWDFRDEINDIKRRNNSKF